MESDQNIFWKKFDYSLYALVDTTDSDGICVVAFQNKWSPWSDYGGDPSITDVASCQAYTKMISGRTFTGQAKPGRSFRNGFMNTSQACTSGICPSQLWVNL